MRKMTCYLPKSLMMLALVLMISVNAIAQGLKATGTVIDQNGASMMPEPSKWYSHSLP